MHIESNDKHLDYNLINPRHRVDFFAQSAAVVRVRQNSQQPFRAVGIGNNLFPGYAGAVGIEGFNGPDALINPYYNELVNAFDVHRHPTLDWMPYVGEDDPARIARALDLFNVRYIFSYRSIEPPPDAHLAVRHDLMVYERHTVWPRAFFVKSADIYDDVEGFVSIVMKGSGPLAAIQRSPEGNPLPPARTANDKLPAIPATNYRLTANTTAFTIDAPHPGIVVLTEAYVPEDFELTVNGQAAEYFRVNHAFRGIYLDSPGKYDISYTYWPRYLTAALWLSAFAAILLLVAAIAPFVVPLCYRKLFGTN
jgi:hypothetical protein